MKSPWLSHSLMSCAKNLPIWIENNRKNRVLETIIPASRCRDQSKLKLLFR